MLYSALLSAGVRSLYGIKREQQYREKYENYYKQSRRTDTSCIQQKAGNLTELLTYCMELPSKTPY